MASSSERRKSNLLRALACLITKITRPILDLGKERSSFGMQNVVRCKPYALNSVSVNEPTEFNIYFRTKHNEFRYYIALQNDMVVAEVLQRKTFAGKRTALIFEREGDQITLGSSIRSSKVSTDVNPRIPFLSFLAITYNIPVIAEVQEWFESCVIPDYANAHFEDTLFFTEDDNEKAIIIRILNDMGIYISDYRIDHEPDSIFFERVVDGDRFELPFSVESAGTRKIFTVLPLLIESLRRGRPAIVDELDAKFHPKLLRYIISLYTDPKINKNGAQLIFTSHDMSTMRNDVFRRDEIWFAALDKEHSSELYSLYDIRKEDGKRVNASAAYDKQYLEGRYGADPYMRIMLDWEV